MLNEYVEVGTDILQLARIHAETLIACAAKDPENIESGTSGALLFLMDLYAVTRDREYLQAIDKMIDGLLHHCRTHPTDNYSLYTGRAGVVYMLLRRLSLEQREGLLQECLALMMPVNGVYFHNSYTTDYLYDGRAGTLLVLLQLYKLTKETFLLEYAGLYANKIISNAQISPEGICWVGKEEINLRPSAGFARGAAGIRYVLSRFGAYTADPVISGVIKGVDRFMASDGTDGTRHRENYRRDIDVGECLQEYKRAYLNDDLYHRDHGLLTPRQDPYWAEGTAGILLSGQAASMKSPDLAAALTGWIAGDRHRHPGSLYDGLPGIGLSLLGLSPKNGHEWPRVINLIRDSLQFHIDETETPGGLMHGNTGIFSFLLRTIPGDEQGWNVLLPFGDDYAGQEEDNIPLGVDLASIQHVLLSEAYPRLTFLLEKIAPRRASAWLQLTGKDLARVAEGFAGFMRQELAPGPLAINRDCLADLLHLEKEKRDFLQAEKRSSFETYLRELIFVDNILAQLTMDDEGLKDRIAAISPQIKILDTKWDWAYVNDKKKTHDQHMQVKLMHNLNKQPKEFRTIFQIGRDRQVAETRLTTAGVLILNRFTQARPIRQAITEILQYVRSLSPKSVEMLLVELEFTDLLNAGEFHSLLEKMIYSQIRQFLYRGILVLN